MIAFIATAAGIGTVLVVLGVIERSVEVRHGHAPRYLPFFFVLAGLLYLFFAGMWAASLADLEWGRLMTSPWDGARWGT